MFTLFGCYNNSLLIKDLRVPCDFLIMVSEHV